MPFIRHLLSLSLGAALLNAPLLQAEELPAPIRKIEEKGAKIIGSFDAPDGLKGYAAQYQNRGMTLYLTPDGKHVLLGNLYDADGKDLSAEPLQKLVYAPMAKEVWGNLEKSNWIADGKADAPRIVYLFSDPNCPYCNMFWEQARPWVKAGKVQLRHIMVGIIREDSPGKSAALLAAKDPQQALQDHEKAGKGSSLKPLASIPRSGAGQARRQHETDGRTGAVGDPGDLLPRRQGRVATAARRPGPGQADADPRPQITPPLPRRSRLAGESVRQAGAWLAGLFAGKPAPTARESGFSRCAVKTPTRPGSRTPGFPGWKYAPRQEPTGKGSQCVRPFRWFPQVAAAGPGRHTATRCCAHPGAAADPAHPPG